jgi:hypothetical protein
MALMDKPPISTEDIEMDIRSPAHLEEGDNVEQENAEMSGVVSWEIGRAHV